MQWLSISWAAPARILPKAGKMACKFVFTYKITGFTLFIKIIPKTAMVASKNWIWNSSLVFYRSLKGSYIILTHLEKNFVNFQIFEKITSFLVLKEKVLNSIFRFKNYLQIECYQEWKWVQNYLQMDELFSNWRTSCRFTFDLQIEELFADPKTRSADGRSIWSKDWINNHRLQNIL